MTEFNTYSLKARVYPSVIVLLPCFILAIAYVTNVELYYHYFTSFACLGVFSFVLSQIGRDNGKRKENELFKYWGGKPTSIILRHSNNYLDIHTKKSFYTELEQTIPNVKIPTNEEEMKDLQAADAIYDSCTRFLISRTRDTNRYSLLFKENINYGFRRNLWGMKTWAIWIIAICIFVHSFIMTQKFTSIETVSTKDWMLLGIFFLFALFWLLIVNRKWVKLTAFAYAERLYETLHK